MGLALPAELNGYPGPVHVLELSDQPGLSAEQKARIQNLFDSMKAEAVPLGAKLLEQEAALDEQARMAQEGADAPCHPFRTAYQAA